jgi:cation transport ATPase
MFSPSDYLIGTAAFASFLLSVYLWFTGHKDAGLFVGIWVPSILSFGAYLKAAMKARKNV